MTEDKNAWLKLQKMHFPQALRRARERQYLSRRGLADLIGVTERTILHWENGLFMPRSTDLSMALAMALGTRMDWLLLPDRRGPWDIVIPD